MKNKKTEFVICMLLLGAFSTIALDTVSAEQDGNFTYTVSDGKATITDYTCAPGVLVIPSTLGGYPTVTIGHHAFYSCTSMTSVTIPDSVVTIEESAFSYCSALTSVSIGDSVVTIGDTAFSNCPLTSVSIGDSVVTIGDTAFSSCTSLASITIPDSVTTIGAKAFHSCTSLSSVSFGESVATIGDSAFYHCSSLKSVTIPASVTLIGNSAFSYCSSLASVTLGPGVTSVGNNAFSYCPLTTVTIPDSVVTIGDSAFAYCSSLASVTMGDGLKTIGYSAFSNCPLTTLVIPNNVTTIDGYAFYSCSSLSTATLGSKVKTIGIYAFASCSALTSIKFLGLVAPTSVGLNWIKGTPEEIRGHAYEASNFPTQDQVGVDFHGLKMGTVLIVENKLPQAVFTWSPANITVNQTVTFDASGSSDPDGSLVLYEWDWNNDGVYEESHTTPIATHSWAQSGSYPVSVRVTDTRNGTATKTNTIPIIDSTDDDDGATGTPGFELLLGLCAVTIALLMMRKKHRM